MGRLVLSAIFLLLALGAVIPSLNSGAYEEALQEPDGKLSIAVSLVPVVLLVVAGLLLFLGKRVATLPIAALAMIQIAFGNHGNGWLWAGWSGFFLLSIPMAWLFAPRRA
jgi:hypothetical protein